MSESFKDILGDSLWILLRSLLSVRGVPEGVRLGDVLVTVTLLGSDWHTVLERQQFSYFFSTRPARSATFL